MEKKDKMAVDIILGGVVVVAVAIALVVYILFFYEKKADVDSQVNVSVSEQMEMTGNLEAKISERPDGSGDDTEDSEKSEEPEVKSEEPEVKSEKPETKSEEPEVKSEKPETKSEEPKRNNRQENPETTAKTTSLNEIMQAQQNVDGQSADIQTSVNASSYASQVLELLNAQRRSAGLIELTYDSGIAVAAQKRAGELITDFSHARPDGRNCFTALDDQGCVYQGAGENIAMGQKTPQDVMNSWMQSEGHKANILNASYTRVGIGCYQDKMGQMYWVQLFTY